MKLKTTISIKDHLVDSLRQSYSTLWGWLLPAIIVGINLTNKESWNNLNNGDPVAIIIYYFMIWAVVNIAKTLIFMAMSLFGPLKSARGVYETYIDKDMIYDKGPTNTRIIEINQIASLKSDYKNGISLKMKDGRSDGIFCRGNSSESIKSFIAEIKSKMS